MTFKMRFRGTFIVLYLPPTALFGGGGKTLVMSNSTLDYPNYMSQVRLITLESLYYGGG